MESRSLYNVFSNIIEIKEKNLFRESIQVYLWITFVLSILVLMFRVTSMRILLFSLVAAGLLLTFLSLSAVLFDRFVSINDTTFGFFLSYFTFALGTFILIVPLFYLKKVKKVVSGVFLNLSILLFVPYLFTIIGIITAHQDFACNQRQKELIKDPYLFNDCDLLIDHIGFYEGFIIFGLGVLFLLLFSGVIRKWKALPDN